MKRVGAVQPKGVRKILIVKPSSLGDIVHSLPFLDSVHRCVPHAPLAVEHY